MSCTLSRQISLNLCIGFCLCLACCLGLGCARQETFPNRPITIVCPWAAGGGTDRVSRQLAMQMEQRLGVPVNVINATGGKGVTGHNRGLTARPDGYTLTMMTFELNTMHWMGLTDLTFEDSQPLISLNEDYAALLVSKDAPWQSLQELENAVRQAPGELTGSGTAAGGAWHLALAGWLIDSGLSADDVVWIPSAGSNPSLQQLVSGGVDMVCCSLPEARSLLEGDEIRALGVMSETPAIGFESVPTFPSQGSSWTLGGWRGVGVPKDTPGPVVEVLESTIREIVSAPPSSGTFAAFMQAQKFDNTWRESEDFAQFLEENDHKLGRLLQSEAMQAVMQNRFSPMLYPYLLFGLLAFSSLGIAWQYQRKSFAPNAEVIDTEEQLDSTPVAVSTRYASFLIILAGVACYILLAEPLGFLISGSLVLLAQLCWFGTKLPYALLVTLLTIPGIYGVFGVLLRVPLPRGILG